MAPVANSATNYNEAALAQADAEFLLAQQRYTDASPLLGRRFYDEISSVSRRIIEHPLRYKQFDPPAPPIRQRFSVRRDIRRKTRRLHSTIGLQTLRKAARRADIRGEITLLLLNIIRGEGGGAKR